MINKENYELSTASRRFLIIHFTRRRLQFGQSKARIYFNHFN